MKSKTSIVIVYHSGFGHTKVVGNRILEGIEAQGVEAVMFNTQEALENFDILHQSDLIVFGCPTYMGTVSAEFKIFMEATGKFWYTQAWKNKLAAGFTNSSTLNGDKTNTLIQLVLFAAQHSMKWVPLGILPVFENNQTLEEPNGLASYLGLMTLSDNSIDKIEILRGLETAYLFGSRLANIVINSNSNSI